MICDTNTLILEDKVKSQRFTFIGSLNPNNVCPEMSWLIVSFDYHMQIKFSESSHYFSAIGFLISQKDR
jgi:hypothetical protein